MSDITLQDPIDFDLHPNEPEVREFTAFTKHPRDASSISSLTTTQVFREGTQGWEILLSLLDDRMIDISYDHELKTFLINTPSPDGPPLKIHKSGNDLSLVPKRLARGSS